MRLAAAWHVPWIFGSVSVIALSASLAATASAQTLEESLTTAYSTNANLSAERANLRATDENVPQALSNWRPTVSISGDKSISHSSTTGSALSNGPLDVRPSSVSLSVNQPLWRGGRTEAQTAQALNLVNAERANLVNIEQSVFILVVTDYMDVLAAQADVDLSVNNEQVLRRQLEATQDEFRVGEVTRTDVAQAEASYAQAVASRQSAEGTLQADRASFEHDVGRAPEKLLPPSAIPELPATRDEAISLALSGAPPVVQAKYTVAAAEDNIRLIRGQLLPTVSLQGSISRSSEQQSIHDVTDGGSVTAEVSMPLYEGGAIYSQSRAAQQTVSQRKHQLDDASRVAVQSASQAWDHLQATRATIISQKQQIRANEIALEGVRQEQQVGSRTILDVLNQEQTLFQARVNLVQSQHDEVVYEFTLAQSVGRLTARNLSLPVEYYDPDKNFSMVRDKWLGFGTGE